MYVINKSEFFCRLSSNRPNLKIIFHYKDLLDILYKFYISTRNYHLNKTIDCIIVEFRD